MIRNPDPRIEALSTIGVLAGTSRRQLQQICSLTTEVRLSAGQVLCRQGTKAEEVFLVIDGQVAVSRDDVPLGIAGAGDIIGEMALMEGGTRSATTVAVTEVRALVLSTSEFTQLLTRFPAVADNVRALSTQRTAVIGSLKAA